MSRIIGIALIALVFGIFLKQYNKTAALLITLVSSVLIFWQAASSLADIMGELKSITAGLLETAANMKNMFKVLVIALVTQIVSDMCRDSGESALAGQTETAAKIMIVAVVLPLIQAVLKVISGLVV